MWTKSTELRAPQIPLAWKLKEQTFFNTGSSCVYNTSLHAEAKHNWNNLALVNLLHSLHHYAQNSKVRSRQIGLETGSWLCENAYWNANTWRILSQDLTVPKSRFIQNFCPFLKFENWLIEDSEWLDGVTYQDMVIIFISAIWLSQL